MDSDIIPPKPAQPKVKPQPSQMLPEPINIPASEAKPRKSVLCIEDEHFISELYARALNKAGYETKVIYSGSKGLEEAKTDRYDIILLDIMLPDMLGIEVLKKLRSEMPNLKAHIVITTNLEQEDRERAEIEKQADAYIVKAEITPKQLVEFLNRLA